MFFTIIIIAFIAVALSIGIAISLLRMANKYDQDLDRYFNPDRKWEDD